MVSHVSKDVPRILVPTMLGCGHSSVEKECFPSMLKDKGSIRRTSKETKDGTAAHLCHGLAMGCTPDTHVLEHLFKMVEGEACEGMEEGQ